MATANLTGLTGDSSAEKALKEVMSKIDDTRVAMDRVIVDLDNDLDKVLEKNEKDFLTAYRFHMLNVQSELM